MVSLLPPGNPFVAGRVFDFGQVQATPRATPAGQVGHVSLPYAPLDAPTYPHFAQPVHVVAPHTIPPGTVYSPVMTHRTVYAAATPSLHSARPRFQCVWDLTQLEHQPCNPCA